MKPVIRFKSNKCFEGFYKVIVSTISDTCFHLSTTSENYLSDINIVLQNLKMLEVGQPAPDFSLYNTSKQKISLSDYRGKNVVLLFFPLAFSGTCTRELCEMRDNYSYYEGLNAEVMQ